MSNYGCAIDQALNSFRHFTVGASQTLMLAEVLRPGIYKKRLQVTGSAFEIPKDSPLISSITTRDAFVLVHGLQEIILLFRIDFVFNRDQDGAGIGSLRILIQNIRRTPMGPGREIDGGVGQLEE